MLPQGIEEEKYIEVTEENLRMLKNEYAKAISSGKNKFLFKGNLNHS